MPAKLSTFKTLFRDKTKTPQLITVGHTRRHNKQLQYLETTP